MKQKKALEKARISPVGFDGKATMAAMMIMAVALYGVEPADMSPQMVSGLESVVLHSLWTPSRPCR